MNLEEKIKQVEKELVEIKKEMMESKTKWNDSIWIPCKGEEFWTFDGYGDIFCFKWGDMYDDKLLSMGNYFKTEEEAHFWVERFKVIQQLKQFARPFKIGKFNYSLSYDYNGNELDIDWDNTCVNTTLYFESVEIAQKAIETVGEERIKKYYLQVEC